MNIFLSFIGLKINLLSWWKFWLEETYIELTYTTLWIDLFSIFFTKPGAEKYQIVPQILHSKLPLPKKNLKTILKAQKGYQEEGWRSIQVPFIHLQFLKVFITKNIITSWQLFRIELASGII